MFRVRGECHRGKYGIFRFEEGHFYRSDSPRSGRPSDLNGDRLTSDNPGQSKREAANRINCAFARAKNATNLCINLIDLIFLFPRERFIYCTSFCIVFLLNENLAFCDKISYIYYNINLFK